MVYILHKERILTWSLEVHLVDHCNLACEHCCTLSPFLPPRFVPLDRLERDLTLAAAVLRPKILKLTGGEPLLHPDIVGCLEVVRATGISECVSITTNGFPAPEAPSDTWSLIHRLTVSLYPSTPLPDETLRLIDDLRERHSFLLNWKSCDRFARMNEDGPRPDADRTQAIYEGCWLKLRCNMLRDGRFYKCTRPPYLDACTTNPKVKGTLTPGDGIPLSAPDLFKRVLRYLESSEPLLSCRLCLGASGEREPHRQLERAPAWNPARTTQPTLRT
jgi:hypothetical protein